MIIHAGEYNLRSFTIDDVNSFYQIAHDPIVNNYVHYAYPENMEECIENVQNYSKGDCVNDFYLVIEKGDVMVGAIIAVRMIEMTLDVSAFISKEYRRQGIMTIAIKAFAEWLKSNTEYEGLIFDIDKNNTASLRQVVKCNAVLEKEYKKHKVYKLKL